jgi:hypothetical protein
MTLGTAKLLLALAVVSFYSFVVFNNTTLRWLRASAPRHSFWCDFHLLQKFSSCRV